MTLRKLPDQSGVTGRWQYLSPTMHGVLLMCLPTLAFAGMHATVRQSLKETDPTAVLPFDFLKLIWAALLAAWLFNEVPDIYTWVGAAVIFLSGLYIAYHERRAKAAR